MEVNNRDSETFDERECFLVDSEVRGLSTSRQEVRRLEHLDRKVTTSTETSDGNDAANRGQRNVDRRNGRVILGAVGTGFAIANHAVVESAIVIRSRANAGGVGTATEGRIAGVLRACQTVIAWLNKVLTAERRATNVRGA